MPVLYKFSFEQVDYGTANEFVIYEIRVHRNVLLLNRFNGVWPKYESAGNHNLFEKCLSAREFGACGNSCKVES